MLPKQKRLNLKQDFKWVASGKKLDTRYLRLFLKTGNNETPRIGIATSGKFFRKSTERNRARRLASAAFESIVQRLKSNVNIVALPKAGITGVKSQDVLLDLEKALLNENIIN